MQQLLPRHAAAHDDTLMSATRKVHTVVRCLRQAAKAMRASTLSLRAARYASAQRHTTFACRRLSRLLFRDLFRRFFIIDFARRLLFRHAPPFISSPIAAAAFAATALFRHIFTLRLPC